MPSRLNRFWPCLAALLAAGALSVAWADSVIENFERSNAPAPWTFSNGPEFPGATGSLSAGTGHAGTGAHLAYDLSQGGHYVSANLALPAPLTTAAIGFWVKSPPNISIRLRVGDATGQTLQYNLSRPLGNLDAAIWYQHIVALAAPNGWWGGTNDGQVHFPISRVSILAGDPPWAGAVGAIDFDDVTAISSTVFDLDPARQALVPAPPGSGEVLTRLGVNIHFTSDNRALDAVVAGGLSWVRMDLTWSGVETSAGSYNWTAFDGLLNSLQTRGLKALFILDYGNALYTGSSGLPPTNAAAITAFGNYAEAAARHFAGRGVCFEVWNEPNIAGFWAPAPDPAQYAALAREAIRRVHAGDPTATVVTGGLAGFDFNFANTALSLGAGTNAAAVGVHPYDCQPPERLTDRLLVLRDIVAQRLASPPPVWDTEWGFSSSWYGDGHSTAARQRQAVMVARELWGAASAGFPLVIYYDVRDDGADPTNAEHNFGLLANDYTDKTAMQAVKTLAAVARRRRFSGFIPTMPSSAAAFRLDSRTNLVVAYWPTAGAGSFTVTVPTNTVATDFLGGPLTLVDAGNRRSWTAYESNGPVYFSIPGTWQATNLAPVLAPVADRIVVAGATVVVTTSVANTNWLVGPLTYSLLTSPPPPAGAAIDSASGVFTWRPGIAQGGSTNLLGVIVSDGGSPSLSATQTFTITVLPPVQPICTGPVWVPGAFGCWVTGDSGPDYSMLASSDLLHWTPILTRTSPAPPFLFVDPAAATNRWRFYRVRLGP